MKMMFYEEVNMRGPFYSLNVLVLPCLTNYDYF